MKTCAIIAARTSRQDVRESSALPRWRDAWPAGIILLLTLAGCTTTRFLPRATTGQASTYTDVFRKQILDNLALFANNRAALPYFAMIADGTTQVTDQGTVSPTIGWVARGFNNAGFGLNGNRSLLENWKLQPVTTAGRIQRMRCAYQFAFQPPAITVLPTKFGWDVQAVGDGVCVACVSELVKVNLLPKPKTCVLTLTSSNCKPGLNDECEILKVDPTAKKASLDSKDFPSYLGECPSGHWKFCDKREADCYANALALAIQCRIPSGWFCIGTKKDVHDVCSFGVNCDTYSWVRPGAEDAYARFAVTILALATLDPPPTKSPDELKVELSLAKELLESLRSGSAETKQLGLQAIRQLQSSPTPVADKVLRQQAIELSNLLGANELAKKLLKQPERDQSFLKGFRADAPELEPLPLSSNTLAILTEILRQAGESIDTPDVKANVLEADRSKIERQLRDVQNALNQWIVARTSTLDAHDHQVGQLMNATIEAADRLPRTVSRVLEAAEAIADRTESMPTDIFSRPGYMPLSRPAPGPEFIPQVPNP